MAFLSIRLIPTTLQHLDAEDEGVGVLCRRLNLPLPETWPPEHNDAQTRQWFRQKLLDDPASAAWGGFYIVSRLCDNEALGDNEALAGLAGYHGPPKDGVVEVGYSVIASQQRRGLATMSVRLLCAMAFQSQDVDTIKADTLPDLIASQGVLLKCGFEKTATRRDESEGEVWEYRLTKNNFLKITLA